MSASAQHPAIGGYNVYFGDLHNHSNVSDGSGTPAQAYKYARDSAHLDFFGLTDHSASLNPTNWANTITQANLYNQNGVFAAFYGFEWSSKAGYGHVSVINSSDYCPAELPTLTLPDLLIWLESRPAAFAYFNHPGKEDSIGIEFDHFTAPVSGKLAGIELWNQGNGFIRYYYNDGYYPNDNNKSYIDEANSRGWKLGALGSGDDHSGTWGTAHPYRMAILSNNLTRTDLLAAIQARRFYSTLDKNLALSFKINRMEMGSTLHSGRDTILIKAYDPDNEIFTKVVLYNANHDTVNYWSLSSTNVSLSQILNTSDGEYYYVKVTEADGDEAISSPVWIADAIANQSPICSIIAPAGGASYTAPATINIGANAVDSDGSITRVEFYQGSTKLGEATSAPWSFTWSNVPVGSYKLTVVATDNSGASSVSFPVKVNVTPRPITVTADALTKIYGQPDPVLTYHITSGSLAGSDTFTGVLTRDAGENQGTYSIRQGTLKLNSNYVITFITSYLTIDRRPITVSADWKTKVYGDPDPALTYHISSGSLVSGDNFSGSLTRNAGEAVGSYPVTQGSLALGSNYNLTFAGANLVITKRLITVTANVSTKVYGENDVLTFRITAGSLAGGDSFIGALTRDPGENIGTYIVRQGTLSLGNNYSLSFIGAELTIYPAAISIAADPQIKSYGMPDPILTFTIISGHLAGSDKINGSPVRDPGENVGTYSIRKGTLDPGRNYVLSFTGAELEVLRSSIVVTADSKYKVYGDADPALTYQITTGALYFGDLFNGELSREAGENVGTYTIGQGTLNLSNNYILGFTGSDFEINPRPVTVTANDRTKVFGEPDPGLTYTITSGNLEGLDTFSGSLSRERGENVGSYPITRGSLALSSNYTLTFIGAEFSITPEFEMSVYPNPFTDFVCIELELNNTSEVSIDIFCQDGRKVATIFSGYVGADIYRITYVPVDIKTGVIICRLTIDGQIMAVRKAMYKGR